VLCETVANFDKPLHKVEEGLEPLSLINVREPTLPPHNLLPLLSIFQLKYEQPVQSI